MHVQKWYSQAKPVLVFDCVRANRKSQTPYRFVQLSAQRRLCLFGDLQSGSQRFRVALHLSVPIVQFVQLAAQLLQTAALTVTFYIPQLTSALSW